MGYASVSIGLFLLVFAYFTIHAPNSSQTQQTPQAQTTFCETVDDPSTAPTFQAPADNITKTGSEDDETLGTVITSGGCGGTQARHQFSTQPTTYRMIRKNVPLSTLDIKGRKENFKDESCHFDSSESLNLEIGEVDSSKFKIFFPEISGEISLGREIPSRTRGGDRNLLYFIDYGLVFLLHKNADGKFTEYAGGTTQGKSETFYLADVYQDIGSGRPDLPTDAFDCDKKKATAVTSGQSVLIPEQNISKTPDQIQLQYFVLNAGGDVYNGWGIHCKPAVYLYPPKKQLVNVKVHPSGFLTYVDPPYDSAKGWTVWAYPNGKIQDLRFKIYDYLYFESKVPDQVINKPTQGWVRKYDELELLYKEILPKLGLNDTQTKDFIDYWKKALPESPYYFVGIIDQENVNQIEKLEITPKPDSINRVRVYFERLDEPKVVESPNLLPRTENLEPNTFSVTEWGGMVKNDPDHPFTCSQ